jgi:hypothetical protein
LRVVRCFGGQMTGFIAVACSTGIGQGNETDVTCMRDAGCAARDGGHWPLGNEGGAATGEGTNRPRQEAGGVRSGDRCYMAVKPMCDCDGEGPEPPFVQDPALADDALAARLRSTSDLSAVDFRVLGSHDGVSVGGAMRETICDFVDVWHAECSVSEDS